VGFEPQLFPRADLVEAFLTGIPGVNMFPTPDGGTPPATCEMLPAQHGDRPHPAPTQNYLGAALCVVAGQVLKTNAGCDPAGFPNGRRPGDDVTDLALDVMEGYLIPADSPAFNGKTTLFTDGVQQLASQFDVTFPYLKTPTAGANGNGT